MAIKYEVIGETVSYKINYCAYSRLDSKNRVQKQQSGVLQEKNLDVALKKLARIERELADDAKREVTLQEGKGIVWGELVERWKKALKDEIRGGIEEGEEEESDEGLAKTISPLTAKGYIQSLEDFTKKWSKMFASEITPGDVEELFRGMTKIGYSTCRQYNVKVAISRCFRYGIMKRLVPGVTVPPTWGLGVSRKQSKRPEILNVDQIETLVTEGYARNHAWRQIWKGAYHTGGRSGELFQLKRKHIDLIERMIHFEEKWNFGEKRVEKLKDGEWRHVPINDDLFELFEELGVPVMGSEDFVFPRITAWKNGESARILRKFCDEIKVPSICFHTLRACWATQLLKNKVPEPVVMSMGGWADPDTMHRYIRLSGIEVSGATDSLSFGKGAKRERPARVLRLVPKSESRLNNEDDEPQDLLSRLVSANPRVMAEAQLELEALRRKQEKEVV